MILRLGKLASIPACVFLLAAIPAGASAHARRAHPTSKPIAKHAAKAKLAIPRGIEDSRATELQTALIKAGYLTGEPSGHWDSQTQAAMGRLQADNGWQTKLVPDSRAIIKLGLGPSTAYTSTAAGPAALANPSPDLAAR